MNRLKVKVERLSTRCEICHQSDLFNRASGYCERCRNMAPFYQNSEQQLEQQIPAQEPETDQRVNIAIYTMMAISCVLGLFVGLTNSLGLLEVIILTTTLPLFAGGLFKLLMWSNKWYYNG